MLARLSVLARTHSQKLFCHHEQSWLYIPYLIGNTPSLLGRGLGWVAVVVGDADSVRITDFA